MPTRWEVTKAVRASDLPAPSRLVMLVLADVAEVGTAEIPERFTPSLSVLARETGLGRSTVAEHLALLEAGGWLVRDRPDDAAMARGERTRYKLTTPMDDAVSNEDDVVSVNSSTLVQQKDYPSPAPGLPPSSNRTRVVQELDGGSPGAGLPYKEVRSSSDQSDLFGASPSAPPPENGKSEQSARDILAAFVDYCAKHDVKLPTRIRGHYAKVIKEALDDKFDGKLIRTTLAKMLADNVVNRPSLLPNRLVEAQTGPERRQRASPHNVYRNPMDQDEYDDWSARR